MGWGCGVGRGNKPAPRGRLHSHGRCRRLVRVHVGNIVVRRRSVLVVLVCRNLGDMLWHRIAGLLGLRLLGAVMFVFGGPVSFGPTRNIKNKKCAFFFPRKLNPKKCVLQKMPPNTQPHTATTSRAHFCSSGSVAGIHFSTKKKKRGCGSDMGRKKGLQCAQKNWQRKKGRMSLASAPIGLSCGRPAKGGCLQRLSFSVFVSFFSFFFEAIALRQQRKGKKGNSEYEEAEPAPLGHHKEAPKRRERERERDGNCQHGQPRKKMVYKKRQNAKNTRRKSGVRFWGLFSGQWHKMQ